MSADVQLSQASAGRLESGMVPCHMMCRLLRSHIHEDATGFISDTCYVAFIHIVTPLLSQQLQVIFCRHLELETVQGKSDE